MFEGFTKETGEFLWELSFNNERPWFAGHRDWFERCLNTPFRALAEDCFALMQQQFPDMELKLHISRIYRDARRLFGRGPYKDHLWFCIGSGSWGSCSPGFWFEIGPASFEYGMGFFSPPPAYMEAFRRAVAANPSGFRCLARQALCSGFFRLEGEEYKRPKGSIDPETDLWYNRRWISLSHREDLGGDAFSPEFPRILAERYGELMDMYRFLLSVCRTVDSGEGRRG